jgi:hypothetical protein
MDYIVLLAGALTLGTWSFLYKENVGFRFIEHLLIGVSSAYMFVSGLVYIRDYIQAKPILLWLWPILLGLMLYFYFFKQYMYLYRIPMAFMVGIGTAMSIRAVGHAVLIKQVAATIAPIDISNPIAIVNYLILFLGTSTALLFFTFTRERKGGLYWAGRIGRMFLMVAFGATFGRTAMTRFSTDIDRASSIILTDAIWLLPIFFALIGIDLIRRRDRGKKS